MLYVLSLYVGYVVYAARACSCARLLFLCSVHLSVHFFLSFRAEICRVFFLLVQRSTVVFFVWWGVSFGHPNISQSPHAQDPCVPRYPAPLPPLTSPVCAVSCTAQLDDPTSLVVFDALFLPSPRSEPTPLSGLAPATTTGSRSICTTAAPFAWR